MSNQARSQDQFWGVRDPQKVDLLGPNSGLSWTSPPYPPTKTAFLAHFVAKSGPFGRFGGKAVASLTLPGGQEFLFPHFSLKFQSIFPQTLPTFFLILGPPGGRVAHPGRPWLRHCLGGIAPPRTPPGYGPAWVINQTRFCFFCLLIKLKNHLAYIKF